MAETSTPLLVGLFPPSVATEEGQVDDVQALLRPEEAAFVEGATLKRRQEFAAGRACAHRALERLGGGLAPILRGEDRGPVWPSGYVGSIAHTKGYCGAAVALLSDVIGLGLDIERCDRFGASILRRVCTPFERDWLENLDPASLPAMAALVFSAKEAFFKAQHPLTRAFVGFREAEIHVSSTIEFQDGTDGFQGAFTVAPLSPGAQRFVERHRVVCRYRFAGPYVATGVVLPAST